MTYNKSKPQNQTMFKMELRKINMMMGIARYLGTIKLMVFNPNNIKFVIWPKIQIWIVILLKKFWNIKLNGPSNFMSRYNIQQLVIISRRFKFRCKLEGQTFRSMKLNPMLSRHHRFHRWYIIKWMILKIKFLFCHVLQKSMPCKIWIREVTKNQMKKKLIFIMIADKILIIVKFNQLNFFLITKKKVLILHIHNLMQDKKILMRYLLCYQKHGKKIKSLETS